MLLSWSQCSGSQEFTLPMRKLVQVPSAPLLSVPGGAARLNFLLCSELVDDAKPPPAWEKTYSKLTLSLVKGQLRRLDLAGCGTQEMPADVLVLPARGNYSGHNEE